jgi:hypothetical protein
VQHAVQAAVARLDPGGELLAWDPEAIRREAEVLACVAAGADRLGAGSAIFGAPDRGAAAAAILAAARALEVSARQRGAPVNIRG